MKPNEAAWHSLPAAAALEHYESTEAGLSAAAAAERLRRDGPNHLREDARLSPLRLLLEQFKSVIIWILIAAGVISGLIGELVDALAILAIVILNAAIGFYQEYSAEKSIAALKKMLAPMAKVWRDGALVAIPAQDVVVGDLLALEAGDLSLRTPACCQRPASSASNLRSPGSRRVWQS